MKHPLKHLSLSLCAALSITAAQAQDRETVSGILEQGSTYAALFALSEGSGDVIGYAIKTQSPVGKAVLKHCLVGMPCKLEQAQTRLIQDTNALKFQLTPSGWYEVVSLKGVGLDTLGLESKKNIKTRYGMVQIDDDNSLYYKGKPVLPAVQGNSSLSIIMNYTLNKQDVLLLQNTGGSACAAMFMFATIDATGIKVTPEFGTCSDYYYPLQDSKTSIKMSIADYNPSTKTLKKAVFRFADGKVSKQ